MRYTEIVNDMCACVKLHVGAVKTIVGDQTVESGSGVQRFKRLYHHMNH